MDTKKLAKIIKVIVEKEIKNQLPALIQEGVKKELKKMNVEKLVQPKPTLIEEIDPFELANTVLQNDRNEVQKQEKHFTSNPVLNEILNKTTPFSKTQRQGGGIPSVLDRYQINEVSMGSGDMEEWPTMGNSVEANVAPVGMDAIKAQMAAKMGYGDMSSNDGRKGGLGVKTGVDHLDKVLNRDYSELVKRFK